MTAAVVLLSMALCLYAIGESGERAGLSAAPAHTIFNRWTDSDGKRCYLTKEVITDTAVYQAVLPATYTGEYLVLKLQNAGIAAYTGGKTLLSEEAVRGTRFCFIPVEELDEGSTVILHLTPYKQKAGRVTADVKLANKNDYLLTLLLQNKARLITEGCLTAALLGTVLLSLFKIKNKKYSGFGDAYFAVFLVLCIVRIWFGSDLAAFTPCSRPCCSVLKTASLLMMPIPLGGFLRSKIRRIIRNLPARNTQP